MSKIKVMDEILANKIAAGEVVEKTMNVVKELVENSIDANSTEISITLILLILSSYPSKLRSLAYDEHSK